MTALPKPVTEAIDAYRINLRHGAAEWEDRVRAALEAAIESYAVERVKQELLRINDCIPWSESAVHYAASRLEELRAIAERKDGGA